MNQPRPSAVRSASAPRTDRASAEAWIVLVHEGTVQQTFAPARRDDAYRALAESPVAVLAYAVEGEQAPPQVPGSKVDPIWGWTPWDVAIDGSSR